MFLFTKLIKAIYLFFHYLIKQQKQFFLVLLSFLTKPVFASVESGLFKAAML